MLQLITHLFLVSSLFRTFSSDKMGRADEGFFSGSSGKSTTSSLMVIDKSLYSAEGSNSAFPIGYPASHVTDSCKRHMSLRCLGVWRQPLQMVRV